MEEKIVLVLNEMSEYLTIPQMKKLQEVIIKNFAENEVEKTNISNDEFLKMFLAAKQIEGCSERTISYYQTTVEHLLSQTNTNVRKITTEEMRDYSPSRKKRPFFLEVFRHTGPSGHLLFTAELPICSRNAETPKTSPNCHFSG